MILEDNFVLQGISLNVIEKDTELAVPFSNLKELADFVNNLVEVEEIEGENK